MQGQRQSVYQPVEGLKVEKQVKNNLSLSSAQQKVSVRSSQIFYNIADDDMAQFFIDLIEEQNEEEEQKKVQGQQKFIVPKIDLDDEQVYQQIKQGEDIVQQLKDKQSLKKSEQIHEQNNLVSRLQMQIQKHSLSFMPVYGQIFIKLLDAQIINDKKIQKGLLLLTNYRLAFFKNGKKKVDLPFGYISQIKMIQKSLQIIANLKYGHWWKFKIMKESAYEQLKVFSAIYLKSQSIQSNFAFSYAEKCPHENICLFSQILKQYIAFSAAYPGKFQRIENKDFQICSTYPQIFYIPSSVKTKSIKFANYWNLGRFPILSFCIKSHHSLGGSIWRSSCLVIDRNQDLTPIAKYLSKIKGQSKLKIIDCGSNKIKKGVDQFQVFSDCEIKNIQLEPLINIQTSYLAIISCFLNPKKAYIKDLLASKWYEGILAVFKGASTVSNETMMGNNVIIKCFDGRDRSAQISALAQIILNPYYRTFQGFPILVQKQFQYFGHPFSTRLGMKSEKDEDIPIFIQFLDCVSQLINLNPMSFEFNYKYLSKLSNLMYTCLFGTFLGQCRKEKVNFKISNETVSIWQELFSELTENPSYQQRQGTLLVPHSYNEIRVWKEHFWYLTTACKQTYKMHPLAEDNSDYRSLVCLKFKRQNKNLKEEVSLQRKEIQQLRNKLQQLKKIKQ